MSEAFICDGARTPVGRYGGVLSPVRTDDLAAIPLKALLARNPGLDPSAIEEVALGCANQAGEDNRNVARMAILLSGLPVSVAGTTLNRLCGSGMDAVGYIARAIRAGEMGLGVGGGVESMSRAPFVMPKAESPFSREAAIYDSTIGWRFVNNLIKNQYGIDSMPETAENLVEEFKVTREDQDQFALRSQLQASRAQADGTFAREIVPVSIPGRKGETTEITKDEHPRADTTLEGLAKLKAPFRAGGTVTAGNASGVNDGAAAVLLADEANAKRHNLKPMARILGVATAGVEPRVMGIGPVPAVKKLLGRLNLSLEAMDVMEFNEAFAVQALVCLRELGLADADPRINQNGGAIALGHPLGMTGARLVATAAHQLHKVNGRYALCTMCIGVGQGIALVMEKV
jgi:acetyl-CoA acyltransferase